MEFSAVWAPTGLVVQITAECIEIPHLKGFFREAKAISEPLVQLADIQNTTREHYTQVQRLRNVRGHFTKPTIKKYVGFVWSSYTLYRLPTKKPFQEGFLHLLEYMESLCDKHTYLVTTTDFELENISRDEWVQRFARTPLGVGDDREFAGEVARACRSERNNERGRVRRAIASAGTKR